MSAPQLHKAARILYQTPLARYLESTAKRQEVSAGAAQQPAQSKSPYPSSCVRCSEIWVPAVTCRVRVKDAKVVPQIQRRRGQNKNTRARRRALRRHEKKQAHFQEVLKQKKGDKYRATHVQYLHFECFACRAKYTLPVLNPIKSEKSNASKSDTKLQPKSKREASLARPTPLASSGRGLSLADFML